MFIPAVTTALLPPVGSCFIVGGGTKREAVASITTFFSSFGSKVQKCLEKKCFRKRQNVPVPDHYRPVPVPDQALCLLIFSLPHMPHRKNMYHLEGASS